MTGPPSVVADLGTHAYHLSRYVTGRDVERVSAHLHTLVPGRRVHDNATADLTFAGGVPGRLWASMAATGHAHGLRLRVFGERASLEWQHEDPHHLTVREQSGQVTVLTQGMPGLSPDAQRLTRVGLGHPEGFIEAFANFYGDVADVLLGPRPGHPLAAHDVSLPTGVDGLLGVQLVEAVAASHAQQGAWVDLPPAYRRAEV